jgi:hypothetical protein
MLHLLSFNTGRRRARGRRGIILSVQVILLDVRHYWRREEISYGKTPLQEETDFSGRDVVLNELRDHMDVVSPAG